MEKNTDKICTLCKWLVIVSFFSLLFLCCRLWVLFFIGLGTSVGLFVWLKILLKRAEKAEAEDKNEVHTERAVFAIQERGNSVAEQITNKIREVYPESKWVWAQSDTQRRINAGEEVFILLNRAGGYRRAKVCIVGEIVDSVEFLTPKSDILESIAATEADYGLQTASVMENYELLAFEWADAHILELNERCNEAIGQGHTELLLTADEPPLTASWPSICEELRRADLRDVECVSEGIIIKLSQETAKEE